ncbi:MAG: glycosyltransferase [Bacteriovoracaceae bacterium]
MILPTLNERENVPVLVQEILCLSIPDLEILVVDDASTDGTVPILRETFPHEDRLRIIERSGKSPGLVNSLKDGIENSTSEFLIWMDADRQMPTSLIPKLIENLTPDVTSVVGSRFLPGGSDLRNSHLCSLVTLHRMLSWIFSRTTRLLLAMPFTDYTSGFIAIRKDFLESSRLIGGHGEYFLYLLHSLHKEGKVVKEIPYSLSPRKRGISKTSGGNFSGLMNRGLPYLQALFRLI